MISNLILTAALFSTLVLAGPKTALERAGLNTSWLSVNTDANLDYFAKSSDNYETNLRLLEVDVSLEAQIAQGVRAVLGTEINRYLILQGQEVAGREFALQEFIKEAYVEIRLEETTGTPIAVVLGKSRQAFGQALSRLPMFKDNLLYQANKIEKVIGFTVRLDKFFLGSILEASVFENSEGDLKIGDAAGMSIRLSKQLTERIKATVSLAAVAKDGDYNWNEAEKRAAMGLVYKSEDGSWRAFMGGIYLEEVSDSLRAQWGAHAGISKKIGPGEVVVEYAFLERVAHQIALAYHLPINEHLTVSPEVTHFFREDGSDETRIGLRGKIKFSADDSD